MRIDKKFVFTLGWKETSMKVANGASILLLLICACTTTNDRALEKAEIRALIPYYKEAKEYRTYATVGFITRSNIGLIQGRADDAIEMMHGLRTRIMSVQCSSKSVKQIKDSIEVMCDLTSEAALFLRKMTRVQNELYSRWGTFWMYGEGGQRAQKEIQENSRKWTLRKKQCDGLAARLDSTFRFFLPDSFQIFMKSDK